MNPSGTCHDLCTPRLSFFTALLILCCSESYCKRTLFASHNCNRFDYWTSFLQSVGLALWTGWHRCALHRLLPQAQTSELRFQIRSCDNQSLPTGFQRSAIVWPRTLLPFYGFVVAPEQQIEEGFDCSLSGSSLVGGNQLLTRSRPFRAWRPGSSNLGNLRSTPTTSRASEPWSVRELLPRESASRSGDSHHNSRTPFDPVPRRKGLPGAGSDRIKRYGRGDHARFKSQRRSVPPCA